MADWGLLVSARTIVDDDQVRFEVRSHSDARPRPFVVLQLGTDDLTLHVWDPETLTAMAAMVAEAQDLLAAALAGQDSLPVELTAARA